MLLEQIRKKTTRPNRLREILNNTGTAEATDLDDIQKQISQTLDQRLLYKLAQQYVLTYQQAQQ